MLGNQRQRAVVSSSTIPEASNASLAFASLWGAATSVLSRAKVIDSSRRLSRKRSLSPSRIRPSHPNRINAAYEDDNSPILFDLPLLSQVYFLRPII